MRTGARACDSGTPAAGEPAASAALQPPGRDYQGQAPPALPDECLTNAAEATTMLACIFASASRDLCVAQGDDRILDQESINASIKAHSGTQRCADTPIVAARWPLAQQRPS